MEFAHPEALGFLLLAPLALLAARLRRRSPIVVAGPLRSWLPRPSLRLRSRRLLPLVPALAVALLAVAVARPRTGDTNAVIPAEGIDIALALDISSSMQSGGFGQAGSRLDVAREVLREFIAGREDDRIGLVVFQEDAVPLSPPTLDYRALDALVAEVEPGLLHDGTGIGVAIGAAVNMLQDSTAASRIVILLTDGAHNASSISPLDAAQLASALGIKVYTIAILPASRGGFQQVDEPLLREIASLTGGIHFSAGTPDDLAAVYDEIGKLETSGVGRERFVDYDEYAPWLAAAGALALLAFVALRGSVLRGVPA
jgi:Ca-activated chloride channel family protein